MKLWLRYLAFFTLASTLLFLYFTFSLSQQWPNEDQLERTDFESYLNVAQIRFLAQKQWKEEQKQRANSFDQCSMNRCFNYSKCLWHEPKVYVYPTQTDIIISPVYEKILRAIRSSACYTENPEEACLFVLSLDTTDRDRISDNYIKDLSARIELLPKETWNEGRNHLIFNLYYGSYPDYSQKDIGFVTKNAIMAWASADSRTFRQGFDISFPLFHKEHPFRVAPQRIVVKNPENDQYLSSFKGKRYVYGIGSNTRDSLYHLHNQNSTIILTTCKHNTDWKKFEDSRCARDNREYDNYDYISLLENSAFCLTPRGRRLGSFRFLEALKVGCIPVILSDNWELPFSEVIDWSQAAIQFHERAVFFTTDALSSIPSARIARMKLNSQLIYHQYFSSVEKIVLSSIQTIFNRLKFPSLLSDSTFMYPKVNKNYSKFIVVIQATKRLSNRIAKIIDMMAKIDRIEKFIVLWPKTRGSTPERSAFPIKQTVEFVQVEDLDQGNLFNLPFNKTNDFVLFVDERVKFNKTTIEHLMKVVEEQPNRLVSYYSLFHEYQLNKTALAKTGSFVVKAPHASFNHSIGLLHLATVHQSFLFDFKHGMSISASLKRLSTTSSQCPALLFNVYMAEKTLETPICVNNRGNSTVPTLIQQNLKHYSQCLNKIIRSGYEENSAPLLNSNLRHS